MSSNFEISGSVKRTQKGNVNWYYGGGEEAWSSIADAKSNIPIPVRSGLTIGVIENNIIVEYIWNPNDTSDNGLKLKVIDSLNVNWLSPSDKLSVTQKAVEDRVQALVSAINAVDVVVEDISARTSLGAQQDGFNVWVEDASEDPTVESGWAVYKWLNDGWVKESEQESIDIDLSPYMRYDTAIDDNSIANNRVFSAEKIINELALKASGSLTENHIEIGDETNNRESVLATKVAPDSHLGDQELSQEWLSTNKADGELSEFQESNTHAAVKMLDEWLISKKLSNQLFTVAVDFTNPSIWVPSTKTLNLSTVKERDIVSLTYFVSSLAVSDASNESTATITVSGTGIRYLENDMLITITNSDPVDFNGDFMVKNIDYVSNTFELYETDGVTPVDSSAFGAYVGLGIIDYTSGKYEPTIENITGFEDGQVFKLQSVSNNFNPILLNTDIGSITTNQINHITSYNEKLIGSTSDDRDQIEFLRVNGINRSINLTKRMVDKLHQNQVGWEQISDTTYTSGSPLLITEGNSASLTNDGLSRINSYLPEGVTEFWDSSTNKFTPVAEGDTYLLRIDFTAWSDITEGFGEITLDIGGGIGVIMTRGVNFPRGAGSSNERKYSTTTMLYTLSTFVANGGSLSFESIRGDISIYDINFIITKLSSAKIVD